MWESIRRFTQPPVFSDDQAKTRQARMLNDVLVITMLAVLVALPVSIFTNAHANITLLICLFIAIIFALRWWMLRGSVRQASYALVGLFLCGVTAISIALGTAFSAVTGYYILAVVIAGLLLDSWAMAATAIVSLLTIAGVKLAESNGWLPPESPNNTLREWLTMLVISVNTGLFIHLTRLRYQEELRQRQLAEQNVRKSEARFRQLYITAQRQTQEIALVDRVRLAIARELDISAIIRVVVEAIAETFGYALVTLFLLEDDLLINQYQLGYKQSCINIPLDRGVTGRVARTGQPELVEDICLDPDFIGDKDNVVSEVCVPLTDQGKVVGVLNVESLHGVRLTEADLQLMTTLSEHISLAIGRARLYTSIQASEASYRELYTTAQRQAQELALLDRVRLAIAGEMDLSTINRTVIEAIAETFGYTLVSIFLLEGDNLINQHQVGYRVTIPVIPIDKGVSGKVVRSGMPILLEDVSSEPEFIGAVERIVSEVCVPLFDRGKVVGILNVESTQGVKLTEADLRLMTALSEHISLAIGRARLYAAVRTSEERYRTLAETAPDAIFIIDQEGNLTYLNSAALSQLGIQPEQIVGQNITTLMRLLGIEDNPVEIKQLFENTLPLDSEMPFLIQGRQVWFDTKLTLIRDENGAAIALLGIARDVTERKRVEEALQKRAQELTTLNSMGRHVSASLSLDEVVQAALDEVIPSVAPDLAFLLIRQGNELVPGGFAPKDSPLSRQNLPIHQVGQCLCGLAASQEKPVYSGDILNDERCTWEEFKQTGLHSFAALPLFGNNQVIGVLGLATMAERDFSSDADFLETLASQIAAGLQNALLHEQQQLYSQRLEERVRQRTGELEAKNRELETFSYSVSHDLKTPLRGIDGYSRLLLSDYANRLDEEGLTFLNNIRSGVNRMSQLIDDLLAYTHLERRDFTPTRIEPRELVEKIISEHAKEPQNKVKFVLEIPAFSVRADRESLAQALRNLIDNAVKFSCHAPEPQVEIGGWEDSKTCVIYVRDNGIGFDMKYADRIFEIFNRLNRDEEYPGTGVGLALVRKAMERMGGHVRAESLPGQGATFYLEVPK
jgi:PAS domain S-box-containing protein